MIELLQLLLKRQGLEVIGARGGEEGLQIVEETPPDVILLDIMMPEMDGWEVYNRLKQNPRSQHIPVIVVTARAQPSEKIAALREQGVDDYITKPFGPVQLLQSIERVLDRKQ
jgi:CheY-like chemotaxis protein